VAPRAAVRRVIDSVEDLTGVALIFGLSFTLNAMILIVKAYVAPDTVDGADSGSGLELVLVNLIASAILFGVMSAIVYGVGTLFGGEGSFLNIMAALAWHNLATVIFAPFLSFQTLATGVGGGFLLQLGIMLAIVWLLVNFVAEAHRFPSTLKVAAVMFGLLFLPAFLLSIAGFGAM
ncbi:MAG: Yip1 family protein, partial [Pseudomonadota bacterium]